MTKPHYVALLRLAVGLLGFQASGAADVTPVVKPLGEEQASHYIIDAKASQLLVLVRRASVLAKFGHNHIISTTSLAGSVYRHNPLNESTLELTIPVADFVIDNPTLRLAEGDDFASVPTERDIAGTRRNMLGKRLLNAQNFAAIQVLGTELETQDGSNTIQLTMQVKDTALTKQVPLTLELNADRILAMGEFELTHRELGLKPFSVMLGALRVADGMLIRFSIVARRVSIAESDGE